MPSAIQALANAGRHAGRPISTWDLRVSRSSSAVDGVRFSKGVRRRAMTSPVRSGFCPRRYVAGALCALLLLSRSSWSESVPDAKPLTAILLIARGDLPDSNFADSVVLVMNNLGPAPVGIIINRPM